MNEENIQEIEVTRNWDDDYITHMEFTLKMLGFQFDQAETQEERSKIVRDMATIGKIIAEANKVEVEREKTEGELLLKDNMNIRDNETKKETISQELAQRKKELLHNDIISGATLGLNVAKEGASLYLANQSLAGEWTGYASPRSESGRILKDIRKSSIISSRPR